MYAYMYVHHLRMFVMYVCTYVCTYVCMYVCMYVFVNFHYHKSSLLLSLSGYENGNVVILCCESMDTSAASCREVVCSIGKTSFYHVCMYVYECITKVDIDES